MQTLIAAYQRLLAEVANDLHAVYAEVELSPQDSAPAQPVATYGPDAGPRDSLTWLELPVHEDDVQIACLRLGFQQGQSLPGPEERRLAQALVELALLLSRARWPHDSLQASRRILAVTEEELQRIILDIHDGPVQKLFAASSQIEMLQSQLQPLTAADPSRLEATLGRVAGLVQASLHEIKITVGALRPPEFRRRPLVSVFQGLIMQHEALTGMRVELHVQGELPSVSLAVKIALYRILQEALSNAYRHAGVDRLDVHLSGEANWITLEVIDQGRGFEPPPLDGPTATEREEHIGLRGMRERAQLIGGSIRLTSHPGFGTRIQVRVPHDV